MHYSAICDEIIWEGLQPEASNTDDLEWHQMRWIIILKINSRKDDDEDDHKDRQTYAIVGMFRMNPIESANISNVVTQHFCNSLQSLHTYYIWGAPGLKSACLLG